MTNFDENRRRIVLQEWIDELKTCRGVIENDSCDKTGLSSTRHEILNRIEDVLSFAESRMPGFDPIAAISAAENAQISPISVELTAPGRRYDDVSSDRQVPGKVYLHRRKGD